jgi:hypothetical protein
MSKFDLYARPLDTFAARPDPSGYTARVPAVSTTETNADSSAVSVLSRSLDLTREDAADEALFNRILWRAMKGDGRPYPARAAVPAALLGW